MWICETCTCPRIKKCNFNNKNKQTKTYQKQQTNRTTLQTTTKRERQTERQRKKDRQRDAQIVNGLCGNKFGYMCLYVSLKSEVALHLTGTDLFVWRIVH